MKPTPLLEALIAEYLAHHTAYGRSSKTISHYQDTFKVFHCFLIESGMHPDQRVLPAATLRAFATWLRATPLQRTRRGYSQRSETGVHGVMRDLRAFVRWSYKEGLIDHPIDVSEPKVPQQLFPVLTNQQIASVWNSSYMIGRSSMAVRNRALLGLRLDTGIRRAEVCRLTLEDIDFDQSHPIVTGKVNKHRVVPFVANGKHLLLEWVAFRGHSNAPAPSPAK